MNQELWNQSLHYELVLERIKNYKNKLLNREYYHYNWEDFNIENNLDFDEIINSEKINLNDPLDVNSYNITNIEIDSNDKTLLVMDYSNDKKLYNHFQLFLLRYLRKEGYIVKQNQKLFNDSIDYEEKQNLNWEKESIVVSNCIEKSAFQWIQLHFRYKLNNFSLKNNKKFEKNYQFQFREKNQNPFKLKEEYFSQIHLKNHLRLIENIYLENTTDLEIKKQDALKKLLHKKIIIILNKFREHLFSIHKYTSNTIENLKEIESNRDLNNYEDKTFKQILKNIESSKLIYSR